MSTVLWWLGQNAVTVAVLIPMAVVVGRLFRHRPAVQHLVWVVVLLKFVTPPVVSWPWSVQDLEQSLWSEAAPRPPLAGELALDDVAPRESAVDRSDTEPTPAIDGPDFGQIAIMFISGVWFAGASVCLVRQLVRTARHVALVRRAVPAGPPLSDEIGSVASQLGLRPPPTLVARGLLSPFVLCLGRPRLIWPEALSDPEDVRRWRGIIAHELAHVRRGDHWVAWLELVAGIVWWWNPLFWFVRRRVREAAEMACDAMALATESGCRREYAERLLELSAGFESGTPATVLGVGTGTPSSFERRLSMVLSDRVSGKVSLAGILVAGVLALAALPAWSWGQQKPPAEPQPAPAEPGPSAADKRLKQLEAEIQRLTQLLEKSRLPESPTPEKPAPGRPEGGPPSALDLADRYLKTVADLKTARSRLARMKAAAGAVAQGEIEAAEIELERAAKLEQFLSGFIKDAIASAARSKAAAEDYLQWAQQMAKKGYMTQSQVDAAKARLEAAEATAKQFESLLSVVPATPMK